MIVRIAVVLIPALSLLFAVQARAEIVWGVPRGIVVSANAPEPEQKAAKEFQRLYKLRTGVELQIRQYYVYKDVIIGRSTLKENPPAEESAQGTLTRGEDWEHYLQKCLKFSFDELDSGGFAYMTIGWTGPHWCLLIAGKAPDDTMKAVHHFSEKYLGLRRGKSGEFEVTEEQPKGLGALKHVSGLPPKEGAGAQPKPAGKPVPQSTPKVPSES